MPKKTYKTLDLLRSGKKTETRRNLWTSRYYGRGQVTRVTVGNDWAGALRILRLREEPLGDVYWKAEGFDSMEDFIATL